MKQASHKTAIIIISAVVVALFICAVAVAVWFAVERHTYVFSVNGVKIEREELIYAMDQKSITVATDIETRYGADSGEADFWDREFDGKTPNQLLRHAAAQAIIEDKVQQIAAKKQGIDVMLSYSLLEKAREKENRNRATGNDIQYGPDELSFHIFYVNYFMGVQEKLKEALRPTVLAVSEQQIQSYYQAHSGDYVTEDGTKRDFDTVYDLVKLTLEDEKYDGYVEGLVSNAKVEYYDAFESVTHNNSLE